MGNEVGRPSAAVVIPYFGTFQSWFPLFLDSLSRQSTLDLVLVTDAETPPLPQNARLVKMTLPELCDKAEQALGFPVRLDRPYKLCDLKPAYGLIFEEHLRGYDYWAFGDEDVVYGDLDRLLAPRLRDWPDMVIPEEGGAIGHLSVLRNIDRVNRLVLQEPDYAAVLSDSEAWGYDETSWSRDFSRPSFTRTLKRAEERGELRVDWGMAIAGNVPRKGRSVTYDGKRWFRQGGEELAYYHWGRLRDRGWSVPAPEAARHGFSIDRFGFHDPHMATPARALRSMTGAAKAIIGKVAASKNS